MIKQGYSEPRLMDRDGDLSKEWFVLFQHTCPACLVRKPYQVRMGINYHKSARDRREEGRGVVDLLSAALRDGWNPHHEKIDAFTARQIAPDPSPEDLDPVLAARAIGQMSLSAALDYAFGKKKAHLAKKSVSDVEGVKDFAKAAAVKLGMDDMPVRDVKKAHIKLLLDQVGRDRQKAYDAAPAGNRLHGKKWTGNSYNKYKGYLGMLFAELAEFEAIEYNPCDKIKDKPKIRTNIHRHATEKEREAIKDHLRKNAPRFYVYLAMEFLTGIRPNEILGIKVGDIDWFNQAIDLHPGDGGVKNRVARKVPMPNVLLKYLSRLQLEEHQPEDYIFSRGFKPGPKRMNRDYATDLWKELVKEKMGLNVSLYSFKGLGGEAKRNAGIGLDAVSKGFGHASKMQSLTYLHGEQGRMDKVLRDHTPDL